MTIYEAVLNNIQDIKSRLDELEKIHPYKVAGNPDTYSSYNEGWSDAINAVESYVSSIEKNVKVLKNI